MGDTVLIETTADEAVSIVTQGPQGPSGSEAATLTTTGDLLYRDALANDRLPIGSEGQVLKVASGLPAWGNESGSVTSVAGRTGDVTLAVADVANAVSDSDARLTDARTPTSHAASHATGGSDAIAPADIGLGSANDVTFNSVDFGADFKIDASGLYWGNQLVFEAETNTFFDQDGTNVFSVSSFFAEFLVKINVRKINAAFGVLLDAESITANREISFPDASGTIALEGHTHTASDITSGTLTHERGGLEADVSAYDGLVKISGGSTSQVSIGTGANDVAAGDHTHELNALDATGATDGHVLTADGAGGAAFEALPSTALNDLSNVSAAAPNDNDVLVYDNATSTWVAEAPAAGGVSGVAASAGDVLGVSGSDITGVDAGADRIIFWDDSAGKLTQLTAGSNVAISNTTLNACLGTGGLSVLIGGAQSTALTAIAIGYNSKATAQHAIAIGREPNASGYSSVAIGVGANAAGGGAAYNSNATMRGEFATLPFKAFVFGGTTTDATPTVLNLDNTATNRLVIPAEQAWAVDIILVARRTDVLDKCLVAKRFLGIRRDASNNTALIGSVQTLGTDQDEGSPTWSFSLTADDTNEALQLEVTGAASETVVWRATAFCRWVAS